MGKIQEKRMEKGITQIELGKICSVSDRTVINWEAKDEILYLKDAVRVSKLLEIPLHNLCKGARTPKIKKQIESNEPSTQEGLLKTPDVLYQHQRFPE